MFGKSSGLLLVLFLAVLLLIILAPSLQAEPQGPAATTIVVNSGTDPDNSKSKTCLSDTPCTLRRAIVQARALPAGDRPVAIEFDIPQDPAEGFDSGMGVWELNIQTSSETSVFRTLEGGQITIDGTSQPGGRSQGPKIILVGPSAGNKDGIKVGANAAGGHDQNVIRGLGFQNFKYQLFLNSNDNVVEDNWFGLASSGQEPFLRQDDPEQGSGQGGVWFSAGVAGNTVHNNVFLGLDGTAVTVRGDQNEVSANYVGTNSAGNVPAKQSDPALICTTVDWLGGGGISVEGDKHVVEDNIIAGIRQEISATSTQPDAISVTGDQHIVRDNQIGVAQNGAEVGVCGRGIYLHGSPDTINVEDNRIVNPGLSAISLNGALSNAVTFRSNIIKNRFQWIEDDFNPEPEDAIQLGPSLADSFRDFKPAKVTSIDGLKVAGTQGSDSPCPKCIVELFLDDNDPIKEALQSLAVVTAAGDGRWQATLPFELNQSQRLRTTSTTAQFNTIPLKSAGTTTGLSELYRAERPCTGGAPSPHGVCLPMVMSGQ